MQSDFVQRWRVRLPRYLPARECIDTRAYDVVELRNDTEAKAFVERHHYSGTYPAARFRFGLVRGSVLVGVAVFSHPCNDAVLTSVFGGEAIESVELGRFVLLDDVPGNGETWFLARCFQTLRLRELRGVVAFSDPHPRHDVSRGRRRLPGRNPQLRNAGRVLLAPDRKAVDDAVHPARRRRSGRARTCPPA